jgi:DNA polymerase-4
VAALARRLAGEIADGGPLAVRVVVKVRYVPFATATHSRTLGGPTVDADAIEQAALEALNRFTPGRPVRLLGVRAELEQ